MWRGLQQSESSCCKGQFILSCPKVIISTLWKLAWNCSYVFRWKAHSSCLNSPLNGHKTQQWIYELISHLGNESSFVQLSSRRHFAQRLPLPNGTLLHIPTPVKSVWRSQSPAIMQSSPLVIGMFSLPTLYGHCGVISSSNHVADDHSLLWAVHLIDVPLDGNISHP